VEFPKLFSFFHHFHISLYTTLSLIYLFPVSGCRLVIAGVYNDSLLQIAYGEKNSVVF
jgi:hypothetical protein